ncbi:hypothetical protein MARHY0840 [Marinobacter nauticus ATCC 49840]|nr:hypothetical protein MARHY0840 [Marinobacter nauticus ATCC 49840]
MLLNQLVAIWDAMRVPANSPALVSDNLRSKLPVLIRETDFPGRLEDMKDLFMSGNVNACNSSDHYTDLGARLPNPVVAPALPLEPMCINFDQFKRVRDIGYVLTQSQITKRSSIG